MGSLDKFEFTDSTMTMPPDLEKLALLYLGS